MNNRAIEHMHNNRCVYLLIILSIIIISFISYMDIELTKAVIQSWPLALLAVALIFIRDIKVLMGKISQVSFMVGKKQINLNIADTSTIANKMLASMGRMLKRYQLVYFSELLTAEKQGNQITVEQLFRNMPARDKKTFVRDNITEKELTILRALRGFDLIQPAEGAGAKWKRDSVIKVTDFGKYIAGHDQLKKLLDPN